MKLSQIGVVKVKLIIIVTTYITCAILEWLILDNGIHHGDAEIATNGCQILNCELFNH